MSVGWVLVKGLLALGVVAAVVAAVAWVGDVAGGRVVGRDRYGVRVADILCESPPGVERAAFLTEVRFLSGLPETVQAVDPGLKDKLAGAFARHPWVAEVLGVAVGADAGVRVELKFRVPVLAVRPAGDRDPRAVDRAGVLLPPTAPTAGLAELVNPVGPAARPAGEPWPDPDVRRAADLAAEYQPARVEKTPKGWKLTRRDGKVLVVGW